MPKASARRCLKCRQQYRVLTWPDGTGIVQATDEEGQVESLPCPRCGNRTSDTRVHARLQVGRPSGAAESTKFPRFDRGLGMWLKSERHRREVCDERGLIPVDGDLSFVDELGDQWREEDAAVAAHEEYMTELEESPDYAGFREHRDKLAANGESLAGDEADRMATIDFGGSDEAVL